jgi:competence protein ComEC
VPTASWILLSIIVGHAIGAAQHTIAAAVGGCLCIAIAWYVAARGAGSLVVAACLVLAAAGVARATADRWQNARCRDQLVRAATLEFVSEFDAHVGDVSPAHFRHRTSQCLLGGVLRARTEIVGGQWYHTTSRAEPTARSVRVTVATASPLATVSWRAQLRAAGVRRVDSVFMRDAAMARALLLADMHLISPEIRQRWSRSGLVHLLSVSGVHVAIIAAALLMLGTALRLSLRHATLLAIVMTALYVTILGLPPPAVRSAVMFGSLLIAKLRQRPTSTWSVLTLGALLPVCVDSAAPIDLGWQLSVLGVAALAASGALFKRLKWQGGGWRMKLSRELTTSSIASTASIPLIAWYFGTISIVAPIANLFAAPLISVLQPTLFLALLCSPWLPLARFVASAAHPVLQLLDAVANTFSSPTWAAVAIAPTMLQSILAGLLVCALLAAMVRKRAVVPLRVSAALFIVLIGHDALPLSSSGELELHMLDVGQGDAIALRTPRNRWVLIDAGGGPPGIDHGRRTVLPYLRARGGDIVAFILSHPHLDHVGGAPALIGALHPDRYVDAAFVGSTGAYRESLESAAVHRVQWQRVHPGDTLRIDDVLFRFLAPDSTWTANLTDANLASTIVRVEYGDAAMLLVGDAEEPEEAWLLAHTPAEWLSADVLKVGHHGSRTSSSIAFLDAVDPKLALISVGRSNTYGHPSPVVLHEFARRAVPVLRTDLVGTTVVRTNGSTISISTAARHWSLPLPASANRFGIASDVR